MDPNKYKGNEKIKPDTLFRTLSSIVAMVLIVVGIIGIAIDIFNSEGLFEKVFWFFFESVASMLLIPVLLLVLWLLNRWISSPRKNETKKSGNTPMYLMIAAGIYYTYRYLSSMLA